MKRREWVMLIILILVAFLVRLYEGRFHPLIASDGIAFIGLAQNLFSGQYQDTFRSLHHHPFYPLLMKGFFFLGGYEMAGVIVSLIMSSLLVVPVFLLGQEFYGRRAAYIGSFLIIFDRILVNLSAEVLNESTYLFLLLMGIYLGWIALERRRLPLYSGATLALTLSYLTKPEGVAGLTILFVWTLISIRFIPRLPAMKTVMIFLTMVAIFVAVASPYVLFLHQQLGYWTLSGKLYRLQAYGLRDSQRDWQTLTDEGKRVFAEAVYDPHSEVAQEIKEKGESSLATNIKKGRVGKSLREAVNLIISMAFPWIIVLVIIGLFRKGWDAVRLRKELYLLSFFSFTPVLYSLFFLPKARHLVPILPLIAVWAGKGLEEFIFWFTESVRKFGFNFSQAREKRITIVFTLIILFPSVFLIFNPGRERPSTAAKEVGLWMKESLPAKPVIMSTNSRVSYYAGSGMPIFSPYTDNLSKTVEYARYHNVEYIVVDEESTPRLTPQLQFLLDEEKSPHNMKLIYEYAREPGHKILVYRLLKEN